MPSLTAKSTTWRPPPGSPIPPQPLETEVAAFGHVAALFDLAGQLDLVPRLDSILPAKRHRSTLSVTKIGMDP